MWPSISRGQVKYFQEPRSRSSTKIGCISVTGGYVGGILKATNSKVQSSKFTNVFFTVALTPSVTSTTPLLGAGWIHLLFNWAYTVLPAPSRGESTLNSPAVKPVPNLPSHGAWQAWSASWCNCNRLRLCTTHLPTPEGWKAELAWNQTSGRKSDGHVTNYPGWARHLQSGHEVMCAAQKWGVYWSPMDISETFHVALLTCMMLRNSDVKF